GVLILPPMPNVPWSDVRTNGSIQVSFAENMAIHQTPEWWLAMHGLTNGSFEAEALADQDNDGVPTWQEHKAGTDPNDKNSVLQVRIASDHLLHWDSVATKRYAVWCTTNLLHPASIVSSNHPATPPVNVYTGSAPAGSRAYYYVEVVP
ncbi:MAG: hypothetical protein AAF492_04080, partial [Verrucomicrobiota bacterium]